MKVKKVLGILLMLTLVLGLMPGSNGTAYAQSVEYDIYNTISGIINLSVKKNDSVVSQAGQGDKIKLTVSGNPSTGNVQDWSNFTRNIMIDGLAVTGSTGAVVPLTRLGTALEWEFTMPAEAVFVTFPILTTNDIPVDTGKAAFRSIKSNGGSYQYTSNVLPGSTYNDPIAFLAYKTAVDSQYKYIYDDDSGSNSNNSYEFKIPSNEPVAIPDGTYFHLGFGIYSTTDSGTFTPTATNVINFKSITKNPQVIEAEDPISIPYGTTGRKVDAKRTTGDGTLFYYVENGSENVISINRETGEITTKAVGSARVRIEASETTYYRLTTKTITVTVKPSYSAQGAEHTIGDSSGAVITVTGAPNDDDTYDKFESVSVGGKTVDAANYTTDKGSLVLTLKGSFLNTLSVGDYKVKITFTDGTAETNLRIIAAAPVPTAAPSAAPSAAPAEPSKPIPKTGDSNNLALWLALIAIGLILIIGSIFQRSLTKNPDEKK